MPDRRVRKLQAGGSAAPAAATRPHAAAGPRRVGQTERPLAPAPQPSARATALIAAAVGVAAFALYLATMAPSVSWRFAPHGDSGDLAAAVATWGIPHPTGYPLWVLAGGLFSHLVPIGQLAYRLGLFSGLSAAGAAVLVFLAALRLSAGVEGAGPGLRYGAAATAALALATSRTLWSQSVQAETYALVALFAALIAFLLTLRASAHRQLCLLALAGGFALAHHTTLGFSIAGAAAALALRHKRQVLNLRLLAGALILLLLPLLLYLLLPLRAAQHPASNWGDPTTLDRFIDVVSGAPYHHYLDHSLGALLEGVPVAIRLVFGQFAWWILPLAVVGLASLWEQDQPFALHAIVAIVLCASFYTEYKADGRENYLIQADVLLAIAAGSGMLTALAWLRTTLPATWRRLVPALAALGALVTVLPSTVIGLGDFNLRHEWEPWNYATATLMAAAPGATVVSNEDGKTFALWYAQRAGHLRPDVTIVDPRFKDPDHQR